jgi:hypothetical protein
MCADVHPYYNNECISDRDVKAHVQLKLHITMSTFRIVMLEHVCSCSYVDKEKTQRVIVWRGNKSCVVRVTPCVEVLSVSVDVFASCVCFVTEFLDRH